MPEKLTTAQEVESPTPQYVSLEASIQLLSEQASLLMERMDESYEIAPDDIKQQIDAFDEATLEAYELATENGTPQPLWSSSFETVKAIPEELRANVLAYEEILQKQESLLEELRRYAPEKAAGVLQKAEELEARLDYEKVVKEAFETEHEYSGPQLTSLKLLDDISWAIAMRKNLTETSALPTYSQLKSIESYLLFIEEKWSERGILKESLEEITLEKVDAIPLEEQIAAIEAQIKDADDIRQKYAGWRREFYYNEMPVKPKNKLYGVIDYFKEMQNEARDNTDPWGFDARAYNEQLETLFGDVLIKKVSELPPFEYDLDIHSDSYRAFTDEAKTIDADEALKNIDIIGLADNLPFNYSEADLKYLLKTYMPPIALAAVGRVEFRPLTEEEDKEDNILGFHMSATKDGDKIVISNKQVWGEYAYYNRLGDSAQARGVAKFRMEKTIIHEFAHALHEKLPVAILKYWYEQCEKDKKFVTPYVRQRFDENHSSRYKEDFAESMMLHAMQPRTLMDLSSTRMSAQYKIWQDFLPNPIVLDMWQNEISGLNKLEQAE